MVTRGAPVLVWPTVAAAARWVGADEAVADEAASEDFVASAVAGRGVVAE
ncbi:hypothetical protein [Mycolicibacterium sp. CH28]|nr:hypothetical protein [Mycolicibacterium sp. CH28]